MPLEHIEVELKDIGTHMSQQDRRLDAVETALRKLAGGADLLHKGPVSSPPGQGGHTDRTPKRSFLTPSGGLVPREASEETPLLDPPGVFTKPEEAVEYAAEISLTEVADLKLEVEGARKAILANKRVAEAMADERDEARDERDKLKMELEESKAAQVEPVTDKGVESLICQLEKDLAFVEQDSGQRTTRPDVYRATIATLRALAGDRKR